MSLSSAWRATNLILDQWSLSTLKGWWLSELFKLKNIVALQEASVPI